MDDLKTFLQQQNTLIELLVKNMSISSRTDVSNSTMTPDSIANSIAEFRFDPESGVTFEAWFKRHEDLFINECKEWDESSKLRLLLRKLGVSEHEKFCNFILPKKPSDITFKETVECLTRIFGERSSIFHTRYQCLQLVKKVQDDYVTYASIVNRECERFRLQEMSSDQFKCLIFVCGLQSPVDADIRTRILTRIEQDPNISLQSVSEDCQRMVNLKHDTNLVERNSEHVGVNALRKSLNGNKDSNSQKIPNQVKHKTSCWRCGKCHSANVCYFKKRVCFQCGKYGHAQVCCKSRPKVSDREHKFRKRNKMQTSKSIPHNSNVVLATKSEHFFSKRKYVTIFFDGKPVKLQVDTGSDITLISRETWIKIGRPRYQPTCHNAKSASGTNITLLGVIQLPLTLGEKTMTGKCYVSGNCNTNLLGIDWIDKFGLWDLPLSTVCNMINSPVPRSLSSDFSRLCVKELRDTFSDIFEDKLGLCVKVKARMYVQQEAKPVFLPRRPVPYSITDALDAELDRLQSSGVISPVNYSAWATPLVVVRKSDGKLRVCGDFSTGLNKALQDHLYPLPIPEDLFSKLNGCSVFSKIDFSDAYLQVEVEEDCRFLLTVNTHRGLFQYNRLPFGIKCAPAIFQQVMDTMLSDVPFAMAYMDDIIIASRNEKEHYDHLQEVFARIREYGFRIKVEKCSFFMLSIRYLGTIIDSYGRRPDPEKIHAIVNMPAPSNVKMLQSFLGMINYYSHFVPNMYALRAPLNALLTKNTKWNWNKECRVSFEKVKQILASDLLLTHYDPKLELIVAADASDYGIGAVILHKFPNGSQKAIFHASRTLTAAEKNYSQIEKEALALVFAVRKFHKMLYGRKFTLQTDHRPLLAIFGAKKGIPIHTANRLTRWATMLLGYDFELLYKPSARMGHADGLSRLIANNRKLEEDCVVASISIEPEIKRVFCDAIRILPVTAEAVKEATGSDPLLKRIKEAVLKGWKQDKADREFHQFFLRRESISIYDNCLMYGERVVIPRSLQLFVLKQFHIGHPGMNRMKAVMRSYVYWPFMDKAVEEYVVRCRRCAEVAKDPPKVESQPWPETTKPWVRLHVDYAGPISGQYFLVVVDSYSKWPEIYVVRRPSTSETLLHLRQLFGRFGTPNVLVSDNGTQFTSLEFAEFCKQNGIEHVRTPPYHPKSNGQAEKFVDILKRALLKMGGEGNVEEALQQFLISYRITPSPNCQDGKSPAEIMFGRPIRTFFDVLNPKDRISGLQKNNKGNCLKIREFKVGDSVYARDFRPGKPKWIFGFIKKRRGTVLYEVMVENTLIIRHVNQLRDRKCVYESSKLKPLPMEVLCDTFDIPPPPPQVEMRKNDLESEVRRRSFRKRKQTKFFQIDPKVKSYDRTSRGR